MRTKKRKVQTKITENSFLKISSDKITRCIFMQLPNVERLGTELRGKIHIHITAANYTQGKKKIEDLARPGKASLY